MHKRANAKRKIKLNTYAFPLEGCQLVAEQDIGRFTGVGVFLGKTAQERLKAQPVFFDIFSAHQVLFNSCYFQGTVFIYTVNFKKVTVDFEAFEVSGLRIRSSLRE